MQHNTAEGEVSVKKYLGNVVLGATISDIESDIEKLRDECIKICNQIVDMKNQIGKSFCSKLETVVSMLAAVKVKNEAKIEQLKNQLIELQNKYSY